jgi:hypothetical protein
MLDTTAALKPMAPPFLLEGNGSRFAAEHCHFHGWVQHPWQMSGPPAENDGHLAAIEHLHMNFFSPFFDRS